MTIEHVHPVRRDTMIDYKLHFLDGAGRIQWSMEIECRDDQHAIAVVGEHGSDGRLELWQGDRLVKRFGTSRG